MLVPIPAIYAFGYITNYGLKKIGEHLYDNYVKDTVSEPAIGSVVYCDLAFGSSEHSGIYIGNGKIVQLDKYGYIKEVSVSEFTEGTTSLSIYTGCKNGIPVGDVKFAERAILYKIGIHKRDYNVILDNCHQFSAACISGDPDNANNFLWMLKYEFEQETGVDSWLVWNNPGSFTHTDMRDKSNFHSIEDVEKLSWFLISLYMEMGKESNELSKKHWSHIQSMPVSGFFLESRYKKWEKKNVEYEDKISRIDSANFYLDREIARLEEIKDSIEKEVVIFKGKRGSLSEEDRVVKEILNGNKRYVDKLMMYVESDYPKSQYTLASMVISGELDRSLVEDPISLFEASAKKAYAPSIAALSSFLIEKEGLEFTVLGYFMVILAKVNATGDYNIYLDNLEKHIKNMLKEKNKKIMKKVRSIFIELDSKGFFSIEEGRLIKRLEINREGVLSSLKDYNLIV